MALIVEDGSVVAGAESYATEAEADIYHAARGNAAWDVVLDKEAALRKATDFMCQRYGGQWSGVLVNSGQSLDWPRYGAKYYNSTLSSDVVPQRVKNACIALALRAATTVLSPDLSQKVISQTVGPITTQYSEGSSQLPVFTEVDAMLAPLLAFSSSIGSASVARS